VEKANKWATQTRRTLNASKTPSPNSPFSIPPPTQLCAFLCVADFWVYLQVAPPVTGSNTRYWGLP